MWLIKWHPHIFVHGVDKYGYNRERTGVQLFVGLSYGRAEQFNPKDIELLPPLCSSRECMRYIAGFLVVSTNKSDINRWFSGLI